MSAGDRWVIWDEPDGPEEEMPGLTESSIVEFLLRPDELIDGLLE